MSPALMGSLKKMKNIKNPKKVKYKPEAGYFME